MKQIVIKGHIASHDKKPYLGAITINEETGLITSVKKISPAALKSSVKSASAKNQKQSAQEFTFGADCLIFAGMGDIHIHAREDETGKQMYKEEYQTACDAALNGGCVYACAMPNTPAPLTTKSQLDWHRNRIASLKHPVSMLNYIGIDTKTKPLGKPGEHFYKLYFGKSVGDLTVTFGSELDAILAKYKGHNISFHVEYEPIVMANAKGETHSDRRPVSCVNEGLRLLLPLIKKYKINAKLCHWSTGGESFELIKEYQRQGCKITLEVSPLHLLFDTSMTNEDPSLWLKIQMNPAIQAFEHRQALIKGLKEGFVNYIATDHAPHTEEEKHGAFAKFKTMSVTELKAMGVGEKSAASFANLSAMEIAQKLDKENHNLFLKTCKENGMSGAPWLDTYGLVCVHLMKKHGFTPQDIARSTAFNPGQFVNPFLKSQFGAKYKFKDANGKGLNYGKGFGKIEKGYVGSLSVLNLKKPLTLTRAMLKSKPGWSPLEGMKFDGSLEAVFVRGKRC